MSAANRWRCSTAARDRADPLFATAGPAQRLMLIEVRGPWGRDAVRDSRIDRYLGGRLQDAADAAGVRLQLIRRPGRHAAPSPGQPFARSVAVADLRPGHEAVQWYVLREQRELLEVNLQAPLHRHGPQQVALVCTHGRHDVCCALRGRPVAAALTGLTDWDVWECSHLGGDRFAPNLLLLPDGDLFGGLDPAGAARAVTDYGRGLLDLAQHRGRFGRSAVEQAALHHAHLAWGERRRGAVELQRLDRRDEHRWTATLTRTITDGVDEHCRVRLLSHWAEPARLTCQGARPGRVLTYHAEAVEPLGPRR